MNLVVPGVQPACDVGPTFAGCRLSNTDEQLKTLLALLRKSRRSNPFEKIISRADEDLRAYFTGRAGLISGLLLVLTAAGGLPFLLPPQTYGPLLSTEVFGGVATFLLFLLLHTLIAERWIRPALGLAFAGAIGAYFLEGASRDLLVTFSVGAILAIALDQWIKSLFEYIQKEIDKRYDAAYDEFSLELGKLALGLPRSPTAPTSNIDSGPEPIAPSSSQNQLGASVMP